MSQVIISATELQANLENPNWKVFEIRGSWGDSPTAYYDDYCNDHILGAYWLDWTQTLIETEKPLAAALATDAKRATDSLRRLGVNDGDTIVLSDNYNHMFACRLWWLMRYFGVDRVRVLNGGWHYWREAGYPTETGAVKPQHGNVQVCVQPSYVSSTEDVEQLEDETLLDGRGAANHKKGSIPGAINIPYKTLIDESSGCFLSSEKIKSCFATHGVDDTTTRIISSCGSGYAGAVLVAALAEIGIDASLYDGSMNHWKQSGKREIVIKA